MKNRNLNHKDDWATPENLYNELNRWWDEQPFKLDIHGKLGNCEL